MVVPMMLTSLEVVRQEVEKLEVRYLANRQEQSFLQSVSRFPRIRRSPRLPRMTPCWLRRATESTN